MKTQTQQKSDEQIFAFTFCQCEQKSKYIFSKFVKP